MSADYGIDDLKIYRGADLEIAKGIIIHQPTLGEICDFGEKRFWSVVNIICATPTDYKYFLSLSNIDWNTFDDFMLFLLMYKNISDDDLSIIFREGFSLSSFDIRQLKENDEIVLYNEKTDSIIDKLVYTKLTDYLRKSLGLKKNEEKAGNEETKQVLLEDAKYEYEYNLKHPPKQSSVLRSLISTMINVPEFKYGHNEVWNMKISAFMDSVNRFSAIKDTDHHMLGIYTGNIDPKEIKNRDKVLNYFKELSL